MLNLEQCNSANLADLQIECALRKFGVGTAENEPSEVAPKQELQPSSQLNA